MIKAYRYTVKGQGFLTALDDYFDLTETFEISWVFTTKLPEPDIDMKNTTSYFTEKGNKVFRKAIKALRRIYAEKGVQLLCTITDIAEKDILYADKYQVVVSEYK